MQLRDYQSEAIKSLFDWFGEGKEKPLVVLPTGTGKSLVQASFIQRVLEQAPYVRILALCHSQELVDQNHDEILTLWPACPAGIYSAGLNRRDKDAQVLFAGIQSCYNKAATIRHTDIVVVDEAHAISGKRDDTMYGRFFADMKSINPAVQILGLTATPFRLDSGNLVPKTFNGICYEYSIIDAIKQGYLCEVVSAPVETHMRADGVHKRGGEYIAGELERAVDKDHLTRAAVQEIIKYGADRKSWLIFAAGNTHAKHITEILIENGVQAECLTQETQKKERSSMIDRHRSGQLKCIVNNMILTTGYNNRILDLIACLRPTQSKGLWVQMAGRGMRVHEGKENCLLLDFGRNLDRHGPIDKIKGEDKDGKGQGEAPVKQCPKCFAEVHAAAVQCPECGFEFPINNTIDIDTKASIGAVFSTQEQPVVEVNVLDMKVKKHQKIGSARACMKVSYYTSLGIIHEFVFFDHPIGTAPRANAAAWVLKAKQGQITPKSVDDALNVKWPRPETIFVRKNGKYFNVTKKTFKYVDNAQNV